MPYGSDVGPVGYAMAQQERQDQSMRNILNLIMALKQYKHQEGQFDYRKQQDSIQNDLAQRQFETGLENTAYTQDASARRDEAYINAQNALADDRRRGPDITPGSLEKDLDYVGRTYPGLTQEQRVRKYHELKTAASTATGAGGNGKPVQWRDAATKYGGMIEDEIKSITALLPVWTEYGETAKMTEGTKRLSKLKALNISLLPYVGGDKPIPKGITSAIENEIAPIEPAAAPLSFSPQDMAAFPMAGGQPAPAPAPAPAPVAAAPAAATYEPGTRRKNKKTGEVQIWTGTKWQAVK